MLSQANKCLSILWVIDNRSLPTQFSLYRKLPVGVTCDMSPPMTNAEIEAMLIVITKTVNTLKVVASNIDELLGIEHTFSLSSSGSRSFMKLWWGIEDWWGIEYLWNKLNVGISLHIAIDTALDVRVLFKHPLCPIPGFQQFRTTLDAPEFDISFLLFVGQYCHKSLIVCPFCGR